MSPFKITFRHSNQLYELNVKLISKDRMKEVYRVWNNAVDLTFENDRPKLQRHPGLRKWRPTWKKVSGILLQQSFGEQITMLIDRKIEEERVKKR